MKKGRTPAPAPRVLPWMPPQSTNATSTPTGTNGASTHSKRPSSAYAQGSSQNPISLTSPSPPESGNDETATSSGKRRKTTKKPSVIAPPPPVGLHAVGLHPTDFSAEYFNLADLEGDNALAQEVVDLTQSDDKEENVWIGSVIVSAVGVRYYSGVATPGEQVLLKRDPQNQAS